MECDNQTQKLTPTLKSGNILIFSCTPSLDEFSIKIKIPSKIVLETYESPSEVSISKGEKTLTLTKHPIET